MSVTKQKRTITLDLKQHINVSNYDWSRYMSDPYTELKDEDKGKYLEEEYNQLSDYFSLYPEERLYVMRYWLQINYQCQALNIAPKESIFQPKSNEVFDADGHEILLQPSVLPTSGRKKAKTNPITLASPVVGNSSSQPVSSTATSVGNASLTATSVKKKKVKPVPSTATTVGNSSSTATSVEKKKGKSSSSAATTVVNFPGTAPSVGGGPNTATSVVIKTIKKKKSTHSNSSKSSSSEDSEDSDYTNSSENDDSTSVSSYDSRASRRRRRRRNKPSSGVVTQLPPLKILNTLNKDNISSLRDNIKSNKVHNKHIVRDELFSDEVKIQVNQIFRLQFATKDHSSLEDDDFFQMLLSIVGAKPDKYSEGQTLEQLIAKEAFDLDLIRKCVFDYQNRINVALQATNSGSIEKYTGDVDELIIVDLLIKSMYDSTTYKGKSYFKTACCEIQKDFKARHKRRPFKNIMKYCDKLYVTVMKITSAYELIVNRLKIGRPHQEIGNQTTPAHNNHNQNTKANDDYKSSPNKKKGKVVKKLLASATEFAPCNGCGKDHINPGIGCFLKTHPDFNHSNKKWKESPIGIIYKKAGIDHIAWKQRWDPDTKAFIEYSIPTEATTSQAKNSKKVNFINNINIIDSDIYLTGRVEALKELPETSIVTNCHILLDTGASSNFVNQKFVDLLTHVLNLKTCECLFKICNAFNKCKELKKLISFPLHISDEKTNEHLTINLAAHIVPNLVCDVIIGRRTMSRYQMYDKFNQHLNKLNKYMSSNKGLSHRELLTSNALLGELDNASLPIKNEEPHQIMNNLKYSHMPSDTLIKFTKDQLINTESEDDHIDPYLTKYDLYDDLYSRPIMLHKNETSDHSEDAHEVVSRHHEIPITASENMKSDSNIQPCVIGPVIEGDKYFVNEINKILCKYKHIFQKTVGTIPAKVAPFTLEVDDIKWKVNRNKAGPRIQSVLKEKALEQFIEQALKDGVIEESQAIYVSQVLLIPKKDKSYRFCIDYRALNDASEAMGWPLPRIDNMITRLGLIKPKHFAVLDLIQGYYLNLSKKRMNLFS